MKTDVVSSRNHFEYISLVMKPMKKEDIAYCGLNCETCQNNFADIREKIQVLDDAFKKVNVEGMVKVIPFMKSRYRGYRKLTSFFSAECPGCRQKGGNPFCGIRECATKKGYYTCAECEGLCRKLNKLCIIHEDNEIQTLLFCQFLSCLCGSGHIVNLTSSSVTFLSCLCGSGQQLFAD